VKDVQVDHAAQLQLLAHHLAAQGWRGQAAAFEVRGQWPHSGQRPLHQRLQHVQLQRSHQAIAHSELLLPYQVIGGSIAENDAVIDDAGRRRLEHTHALHHGLHGNVKTLLHEFELLQPHLLLDTCGAPAHHGAILVKEDILDVTHLQFPLPPFSLRFVLGEARHVLVQIPLVLLPLAVHGQAVRGVVTVGNVDHMGVHGRHEPAGGQSMNNRAVVVPVVVAVVGSGDVGGGGGGGGEWWWW
jgi:hypothetical protein